MNTRADSSIEYHLGELELTDATDDPRRSLPQVPASCGRILDVGCGIGQSLIGLNLPASVEAHGVDIDAAAIQYGCARFPHLRLQVGRGEALPYDDGYFDMVICRVSLPYMHIPRALREFHRVLAPSGQLWLALHPASMVRQDLREAIANRSFRQLMYRAYVLANSAALYFDVQFAYLLNRKRMESYQSPALIRRAVIRAGFSGIATTGAHVGGGSIVTANRPD